MRSNADRKLSRLPERSVDAQDHSRFSKGLLHISGGPQTLGVEEKGGKRERKSSEQTCWIVGGAAYLSRVLG